MPGRLGALLIPFFDGVVALFRLVDVLVMRRRPVRTVLPLVCLERESGQDGLLADILARLRQPIPVSVPSARVDAGTEHARIASTHLSGEAGSPLPPPRLPVLHALCAELGRDKFGMPRLRFDHYLLADWLTRQDMRGNGLGDQPTELLGRLRDRFRGNSPNPFAGLADGVPDPTVRFVFVFVARLWLLVRFWLRVSGRVPGLGRQTRWFMRQRYVAPGAGNFVGFAERLTVGAVDSEVPEEVDKLLVHAFLQDLRTAYRRRPWRIRAWRRTANPVALIDNITSDNGGVALLNMIGDVRSETGRDDPLLVIASCGSQLAICDLAWPSMPAEPVAVALDAEAHWLDGLGRRRRRRDPGAWVLRLTVPAARQATVTEAAELAHVPPFTPRRPPVPARPMVLTSLVTVVVLAAATSLLWVCWPHRLPECLRSSGAGISVELVPNKVGTPDCVGYSDNANRIFGATGDEKQPGSKRLLAAQREIFRQNECARDIHEKYPTRPYITLVYLAGLSTALDEGDAWSAAQSEELEGILLRQTTQNGVLAADGACNFAGADRSDQPLLRIVIANGGSRMSSAVDVVRKNLVPLFTDRSVVGVLGLDRSIPETEDAIAELGRNGIPVMATTLSGDGMADFSPLYFQLVPTNKKEAQLVARYATYLKKTRVLVSYRYEDTVEPKDRYVSTLVDDLKEELKEKYHDRAWTARSQPGSSSESCEGGDTVLFYAGRHEDFAKFVNYVHGQCKDVPIVADDAVSRVIAVTGSSDAATPETSRIPAGVTVDYVSKASAVVLAGQDCFRGIYKPDNNPGQGAMANFCTDLGELYKNRLPELLSGGDGQPQPVPGLRWPGERVGLAYDAVGLFLRAASAPKGYPERLGRFTPSPSSVGQQLRDITGSQRDPEYATVTADFDFRGARVADNRELTVLEVPDVRRSAATPTCVYLLRDNNRLFGKDCLAVQQSAALSR